MHVIDNNNEINTTLLCKCWDRKLISGPCRDRTFKF